MQSDKQMRINVVENIDKTDYFDDDIMFDVRVSTIVKGAGTTYTLRVEQEQGVTIEKELVFCTEK